jgi:hypothetical protein
VLRRDNEAEMIFRAEEIARAIQRYRIDHGAGPPSLEMLAEPGPRGQYYLRHKYRDPLVKDGVWGLLFEGPDGSILDPSQVNPERNIGFDQGDAFGGGRGRQALDPGQQQQQQQPEGDGLDWNDELEANRNPQMRQGRHLQGGGQRIAGVKSLATGDPFRVYKGRDAYSQWLFTYQDFLFQPPAQQQIERMDGPGAGRGPDNRRRLGDNPGGSGRRP